MLYYLNVLHWLYLGIYVRGVVQLYTERKQRKKKQVDQFGQGGSSKFSSDKFGQISTHQFGQSVRTCSDLHNDLIITLQYQ
jgi:hypothetical protein